MARPRAVRDSEAIQATTARASFNLVKNISNRRRSRREVGGAEQKRDGEVPSLSKTGHTSGDPDLGRTTTSSRGPRREKEARLLNVRRDRSELRHSGAHHVTIGVVTQNLVAAAAAGEGMVSPTVQYLTTNGASRVMIQRGMRRRRCKAVRKRRRDMGISRRRTGGEPSPRTKNAEDLLRSYQSKFGHRANAEFHRQAILERQRAT